MQKFVKCWGKFGNLGNTFGNLGKNWKSGKVKDICKKMKLEKSRNFWKKLGKIGKNFEKNLEIMLKFGNVEKNWKCGTNLEIWGKFGNPGEKIGNVEQIWKFGKNLEI